MTSTLVCACQYIARNRKALTKHKQSCQVVQTNIGRGSNYLLSTSLHNNRASNKEAEDDDGSANNIVYEFLDYDMENSDGDQSSDYDVDSSNEEDEHSATISIGTTETVYDELHDCDGKLSDNTEYIDNCDDGDCHSSSSSSMCDTSSSSEQDGELSLPDYDPPMFAPRREHLCGAYKLQVAMNSLLDRNKASVGMFDDLVKLFNSYINSPEFSRMTTLRTRKQFMVESEKMFSIQSMKHSLGNVKLTDDTLATVPVFDARVMILSMLHDPSLMREENFAPGYDIFTGAELDDCECNNSYGEVHTGDAWRPAVTQYCGSDGKFMPVALIVFGDKSHTDLHGLLSVEPVSFTLSLFNRSARNLPDFWRLLGYIPNLSAGKGEANRMSAREKLQNEHNCLSFVFKSLRQIDQRGGIRTTVLGRDVHIKVWIHFIIGDTEGNNKWLGHYPGNNKGILRPYRDCHCSFQDLQKTNPKCIYTTIQEMTEAKSLLRTNQASGLARFKNMSRYPVVNALLQPGLPLCDQIYGAFRMTPPELLHTSGAGLILYMFRVIADKLGAGLYRNELDEQHIRMMKSIRRQSERDFPRGATRNGIVDGTKCQASERRGNLFSLACISFTTDGLILKEGMKFTDNQWRSFLLFIRQYLAMEEWFHSENDKEEVRNARHKIGKVLKNMQDLFPRGEGTNGWNIPKMHGMTKVQSYMLLFGSAINFFGGPGESSHKQFVKKPGLKTQRRVSEFAVQTAKQYHHVMITRHAETCMRWKGMYEQEPLPKVNARSGGGMTMEGKYLIDISDSSWEEENTMSLQEDLLKFYSRHGKDICRRNKSVTQTITGYTRARCTDDDGNKAIFYAHPSYRGSPWYDWAYVHFVENDTEVYYPSKILGFVAMGDGVEAVIQCSIKPLQWRTVEKRMFVAFELGDESESFVSVPITSFVYNLCVIKDYGGGKNKYIVVLPRSGWGRYFGEDIVSHSRN